MKTRIYGQYYLNWHLGKATTAEGVGRQRQNSHPQACGILYGRLDLSYPSDAYHKDLLCDRCDREFAENSNNNNNTSVAVNDVNAWSFGSNRSLVLQIISEPDYK